MDFFSKLGSKITDTSEKVAQKTKDAVELTKLKSQISTEENRIQAAFLEIGKKFFEKNAGEVSEEFVESFNIINEAKAKIAEISNTIMDIKGTYNCPNCGTEVATTAAFCANCGSKLEVSAAKSEGTTATVEETPVNETTTE